MGMNKLFIIMGASGSGKSTIEEKINRLRLAKKVISSTTRKPRAYETDGEDYYFLPLNVFNIYLSQGQFAENSVYTTVEGMARYGINKNDIKLKEENYVCVVNPHGMKQLVRNLGKSNCVTILIKRDDKTRLISSLNRDSEVNVDEVVRRFEADKIDFKGVENEVDYIIDNIDLFETMIEIEKIIKSETK